MNRTLTLQQTPGALFRRFLDRKFLAATLLDSDPRPVVDPHEELGRLCAPFKTSQQLNRLAANPRALREPFEFAVLGDAEPGRFWFSRLLFNVPGVFEHQVRTVQSHRIDFSMQLGDMVSRGLPEHYVRFFRRLSSVEVRRPYLTTIGNHDRHNPHGRTPSTMYRTCFGRNNYAFDHGGVRFVSVDSSANCILPSQLKWLEFVLKTDMRKIVFTHIPPAALRAWTDFGPKKGIGGFKRGATEFTHAMAKHRVDRVYMGHIHGFGVQDYLGVRYVLSGGGGSPLFPSGVSDKFHHYIVVRVESGAIRETVHSLDGGRFKVPVGKVLISR